MKQINYQKIFEPIKKKFGDVKIKTSIILGSGLGDFADELNLVTSIDTNQIEGYPHSTIPGHSGKIFLCEFSNNYHIVFKGRIHLYEGYSTEQVILPAVISHLFNTKYLIVTNAAGGISDNLKPADLMLIDDIFFLHYKSKFKSLSKYPTHKFALSKRLNDYVFEISKKIEIELKRGVYAYSAGPSYETPAEIQFLRRAGCDAVGMSTIPEILYSSNNDIPVVAISCITNFAAGITENKLSHEEVTETANIVKDKFSKLLKNVIKELPKNWNS
ncbi:MAG: purine-nucleoside phosphorylase [Ignavibacteria bacterium]|nr:purine-nucleoside phosphorylase [Ignavibacteria bacterium]